RSGSPTRRTGRAGATGRGSRARSSPGAAVDAEGPEREVVRVQVVLQVEHAREARTVPERVVPAAVGLLRAHQIFDAALDDGAAGDAGGEEPQQRPRRLARQRGADAGQLRLRVALTGLAPAPIGILAPAEPAHRALHVLVTRIDTHGAEPAQHRPRAVDVVHAPAAVPRAVV